jgi:hypothetical protein
MAATVEGKHKGNVCHCTGIPHVGGSKTGIQGNVTTQGVGDAHSIKEIKIVV